MALSYAKLKDSLSFPIIEKLDMETEEEKEVSKNLDHVLIDPLYMLKDKNENLWIYSPIHDSYFLYYNEKEETYTMDLYPTVKSNICPECKLGLRMFKQPKVSSETVRKFKQTEKIQATSDFRIDDSGDIWVHVFQMDNLHEPKKIEEGWIIYKNKRNNFVNILFNTRIQSVITDGELDPEKIDSLSYELFLMKGFEKKYGRNFLQFFAKSTKASKGKGKSATIKAAQNSAYTVAATKREFYSKYYSRGGTYSSIRKRTLPGKQSISVHGPLTVQNAFKFPKVVRKSPFYKYNYNMDYDSDNLFKEPSLATDSLKTDMEKLYKDINLDVRSEKDLYEKMFESYNRFKLPNPDDILSHGFAHIFFTRPDCNVLTSDGSGLAEGVKSNPNFDYAWSHRKRLVTNLSMTKKKQDFNLFLSNKAEEFSLTDESIATATTGMTYHKQQIAYGKTNNESKANGEFTVKYTDNRFLDIFHFHKLWTDYISNVYSGLWYPKTDYLWMKTLDYPCSVYYIITAEDGETILFWSKYYGVFPTNVPSSSYSWSKGNVLASPEVSITYQYSFKEDFNPVSLVEFNLNSRIDETDTVEYEPIFNEHLGSSGYTWVGRPFIETVSDSGSGKDYYFKLRFKKQ